DPLKASLDRDPQAGRIVGAKAAPFTSDASLHGAESLGIGIAAGHAEIFPDQRQVFLGDAQQIDALAAGDLDHGDVIFFRDFADADEIIRAGDAAVHAGDDAECAVILDIGMDAVIDV